MGEGERGRESCGMGERGGMVEREGGGGQRERERQREGRERERRGEREQSNILKGRER